MDIVACDTTISPDLDRNAFYGMVQERANSALSRLEALALAIRVSNTQRYGLDAVKALIDLQILFYGKLGDAIGYNRIRWVIFVNRQIKRIAVHRAPRRDKNDTGNTMGHHGVQNMQRANNITLHVKNRITVGAFRQGRRYKMQYRINALYCIIHIVRTGNITSDPFNLFITVELPVGLNPRTFKNSD